MERAVELGADPDEALAATSMLSRAGATREAIRYLENAYAFTEHPSMREIHEAIGKRLEALSSISDARRGRRDCASDRRALGARAPGGLARPLPAARSRRGPGALRGSLRRRRRRLRALLAGRYGFTWIARRLTMTKSCDPGNVAHTLSS